MTTIDFAASLRTTPAKAVAERAVNWIANSFRAWKNRREFYQLAEMSDVELRDIGLTRGDLAVAVEFGNDPTRHLGVIAKSRTQAMEP